MIWKILASIVLIIVWTVLALLSNGAIKRFAERREIKPYRWRVAQRISKALLLFLAAIIVLSLWGLDVKNVGVILSSVLGLVAIGFVAVWSILSNVLAGFCMFISDAFRIEDRITILPDEISGTVSQMKLMFVVLEDDDGNLLHVPNNVIIQKIIRTQTRSANKNQPAG